MTQRGGFQRRPRRREQAANAWTRGTWMKAPLIDAATRRLQLFCHYAGMLGEHATPQLSGQPSGSQFSGSQSSHSPSLQPAAPAFPVLVYSRTEAGPGGGTQAG